MTREVFIFPEDNMSKGCFGDHITLHPALKTPDDRTRALGDVVKCLGEELIPGIRNEVTLLLGIFSSFSLVGFTSHLNFQLVIVVMLPFQCQGVARLARDLGATTQSYMVPLGSGFAGHLVVGLNGPRDQGASCEKKRLQHCYNI